MPDFDDRPDLGGYRDITCSFCDRHNREVHLVAGRGEITICQVCIAKCATYLDGETGVPGPEGGWSQRWPLKNL